MFFISAGMYLFTWLGYIIVVKGSVVSWAQAPEDDLEMDVRPSHTDTFNQSFFLNKIERFFTKIKQVIEKDGAEEKIEETHDNKAFDMSTNL